MSDKRRIVSIVLSAAVLSSNMLAFSTIASGQTKPKIDIKGKIVIVAGWGEPK